MDVKMLDEKYHVDSGTGCTIRYVKSDTEYFRPHFHNYYEIFLTLHGTCRHYVNGEVQKLSEKNLLFIRDFDTHDYAAEDSCFDFLNMSFSKALLRELFDYLGDGFNSEALLSAPLPPCVSLTERESDRLFYSILSLNTYNSSKVTRTKMRMLLLDIFTKYFWNYSCEPTEVPLWLEMSYEKMKLPENYTVGANRFVEMCGKSREHLSRLMKKHYGITPTDYITELRINHAVNLMRSSNLSITDICYECGFSNLSWFYKVFEGKFSVSPASYKKSLILKEAEKNGFQKND